MPQGKKKFTIPKRVPCRELLQQCDSGSREYAEITSEIEHSLWNSKCGLSVTRIETVNNESLSSQFNKKKLELQKETSKRQEISYGFKLVDNYEQAKNICKYGFSTNLNDPINLTCLGDPNFGIYLSRCADVLTRSPPKPDTELIMIISQVIKGRFKSIAEQHGIGDFMEPTPFYDCHVSKDFGQNDPSSVRNSYTFSKLFDSCLMYLYEMNTDLEDLYVKQPRNCNPYAVVFFRFECRRPAPSGEIPFYKAQPKKSIVNSEEMHWSASNRDLDPSNDLSGSNNFASKLETAITVWSGKLYNKATSLTDVLIKCHAREFTRDFPILGDYLSFHTKTDISRLKNFLPENLYSKPPINSRDPLAYSKSEEYLHCELYPKNQRSTSFAKLTRSLKVNSQALFLKLPFENYLFMLPTSDVTDSLGITFNGYPEIMHLLFIRKMPEDDGTLHKNDAFLLDARTILQSKVLEIEKLKLTTPVGVPNQLQDVDIDSESPFHDNTDWNVYPRYFKEIEKESIRARVQRVRQAVMKEKIMSGHKKYKHTYKTPYFVVEPGCISGGQRTKKGRLWPQKKSSLKAVERSTSVSLGNESLHKEKSKVRNANEGNAKSSLEVAGLRSYSVTRDPRRGRKRGSDDPQNDSALTSANVSHRTNENSSEIIGGTKLFVNDSERASLGPALSGLNDSPRCKNNNTTSNMEKTYSPIWAAEDTSVMQGHPPSLAIKNSSHNDNRDYNEDKYLPSNSKHSSLGGASLMTTRSLTNAKIRHDVSAQYEGRYGNDHETSSRDMSNDGVSFSTKTSLNPPVVSKNDNVMQLPETKLCRVEVSRNGAQVSGDRLPPPPLPPVIANLLAECSTKVHYPDEQTVSKTGDEESTSSFTSAATRPPWVEEKCVATTTVAWSPLENQSLANTTATCSSSASQNTQSADTIRTKIAIKKYAPDMPNSVELNSSFIYTPICSKGGDQPLERRASAISEGAKVKTSQTHLIPSKADINMDLNNSDTNGDKIAINSGGVNSKNINITRDSEACGGQDETCKSVITSSDKQSNPVPHPADASLRESLTNERSLASTQNRQLADNSTVSSNSKVVSSNQTKEKETVEPFRAANLSVVTCSAKQNKIPVVSISRVSTVAVPTSVQTGTSTTTIKSLFGMQASTDMLGNQSSSLQRQHTEMQQQRAVDLANAYALQLAYQQAFYQRNLQFAQRPHGHWNPAIYHQQSVLPILPRATGQSNAPLLSVPLSSTLPSPMQSFPPNLQRLIPRNNYAPWRSSQPPCFIANDGKTLQPNGNGNDGTQAERNAEENAGKYNVDIEVSEASEVKGQSNSDEIKEGRAMGASEENGNDEMDVEAYRGSEANRTEKRLWNFKVNADSQLIADGGNISNLIDIPITKNADAKTVPPETRNIHTSISSTLTVSEDTVAFNELSRGNKGNIAICDKEEAGSSVLRGTYVDVLKETLDQYPTNLSRKKASAGKGESNIENNRNSRKEDSYPSQQKSLKDLSRTLDDPEESGTLPRRLEKQNRNEMYLYDGSGLNLDENAESSEEVLKYIDIFKKVLGSLDREINESMIPELAGESKIQGGDSVTDKNREEYSYDFQGNQTREEYRRLKTGCSEMKGKWILVGGESDHGTEKEDICKTTISNGNNEMPLEVDLRIKKEKNASTRSNVEITRKISCNPTGLTASRNSELSTEMQGKGYSHFNLEDLCTVEYDSEKYGIGFKARQPVHEGVNVDSKEVKRELQTTEIASENATRTVKQERGKEENEMAAYTNAALWEVLDEYLNAKQSSKENVPLMRQVNASDLPVRQKNTVRSRRVKLMSKKITMTSSQDSSVSNRIALVKSENEDEKMPAPGEERSDEEVALGADFEQTDLRAVLNKKRGKRSLLNKPVGSKNDVCSGDDARNRRETDHKVVIRKVSVMGQKIEKSYVADKQKEIPSYNTSSLKEVETRMLRNSEPESSDTHRKVIRHSQQRKKRYSRSDRSRKRRRSDERKEYNSRKRSCSSSSSASDGSRRKDESSRTRIRRRRYHSRDKDTLDSKPGSHLANTSKYDDMITHSYIDKVLPIDERADEEEHNGPEDTENCCIEQTFKRDKDGPSSEKGEKKEGSSLNWYDIEEFNKFFVGNDGVDDVNATTCEKKIDGDNVDGGNDHNENEDDNEAGNKVDNEVGNKVDNEIDNKFDNEVDNAVDNEVDSAVDNEVDNMVGNEVDTTVDNEVDNTVDNEVDNTVDNEVDTTVDNEVDNTVDNEVDNTVDNEVDSKVDCMVDNEIDCKVDNKVDNEVDTTVGNEVDNKDDNEVDNTVDNEVDSKVDCKVDNEIDYKVDSEIDCKVDNEVDIKVDKEDDIKVDNEDDIKVDNEDNIKVDNEDDIKVDNEDDIKVDNKVDDKDDNEDEGEYIDDGGDGDDNGDGPGDSTFVDDLNELNQSALMMQCGNDFVVNDELYSNVSPVSDVDDAVDPEGQDESFHSSESSGDKPCDLVDVPKVVMTDTDMPDSSIIEEYRQLDSLDAEETEAAGIELEHVKMEEDKVSITDRTAVSLHNTSNIMQKLMSDSQSTAKVLLKNHLSPKFKEHPLLFNQECFSLRDIAAQHLSAHGDPKHSSSELNVKDHVGGRQSQENITDKSLGDKDSKNSDMEVDLPESPIAEGSSHLLESRADNSDQENKPVEMELVTDEEEGQVLYCEEIDDRDAGVKVTTAVEGAKTVEKNDNSKLSQLSDKETMSMEMSSEDEGGDYHSTSTAVKKEIEGRGVNQSHHRSEGGSQTQPRREEKSSSKDRSSASETLKYKEKMHPYPGYRFGSNRKSYRLGSSEVHGSGRGLVKSKHRQSARFETKREIDGKEPSNGFSSSRKPLDRFHEGTERFLRLDSRRNYELSLLSQSTSKDDNYGREFSTPQLFSRKAVHGRQSQPFHRDALHGDRGPTLSDVLAARGRKGLDGRMELEAYNLETESVSKKIAGRRFPNQIPKSWSGLNERRKSFTSNAEYSIDSDRQDRYNRIPHEEYKRYVLVDHDPVPIRAYPKTFSKPKLLHSDRFRGSEIPAGSPMSFADSASREKVRFDELYSEDADLGRSIPEYKHDFGTPLRYNVDFGEDLNSPFHKKHLESELFEEHHNPSRHSSRVTYVMSDDKTLLPFELTDSNRVYDARDEFLPYYLKNIPAVYDKDAMVTLVGEREEPAIFGKRKVTMLHHLRDNPRSLHHGTLGENIWSDNSNLLTDEGRVTQPRLMLRSSGRDLNLTVLEDLSPVREGEHESNGYFNLAESRKARQDFIERHVNQGPTQPSFLRYGTVPSNRLYNLTKIPGNRSKTDDDISFTRRRGHLISRTVGFDVPEGNLELSNIFRRESVSDDEEDERFIVDYRHGIRPLDLIHMKRKMQQTEKYYEERSGFNSSEKTFFGELLNEDDHLHTRRFSNDNFNFRRASRKPNQL